MQEQQQQWQRQSTDRDQQRPDLRARIDLGVALPMRPGIIMK